MNAGTENFNLPHDVVKLPSGGVFYKNKKKSLKVGYLTASDENLLISSAQSNADDLIYNLVRSKIYEHDMNPSDLLESDIEAVLLFLRNTSFGPEYRFSLVDPSNNSRFEHTIVLDELNIKTVKNKPNENGTFNVILPKSETPALIRPLTYGEVKEISRLNREYPKSRTAPMVNWRLERQIVEINGDSSKETISKFINEMPIGDSKFIRNYINENVPSLDLKKTIYAPSGEVVTADVAFGVEFFRPFF